MLKYNKTKIYDNIILIGFMGSGKTFTGEKLASYMNINFIDIDEEIKTFFNMTISQIFNNKGEKYFRDIEYKICKKISNLKGYIISSGGGTLLYKRNQDLLLDKNLILFLDTPFNICYDRILDTDRPIASNLSKNKLYKLYLNRKKKYKKISDFKL